jgi:hypothetical protein
VPSRLASGAFGPLPGKAVSPALEPKSGLLVPLPADAILLQHVDGGAGDDRLCVGGLARQEAEGYPTSATTPL